jgi:YYY domain-containing protein
LYGDLHAHMISMPLMLFALAFVFHEVLVAGRDRRRGLSLFTALFFGGLIVGMFQATNTWDYPTFLILSLTGLAYAWWLNWQNFSRNAILSLITRIGGFLLITFLVSLPFTWWFNSGLTEFKLWDGYKTPFWAYFQIHGFFLFFIVSLLVWETSRWMTSVKVRDLRGKLWIILLILGLFLSVIFIGFVAALLEYQVALIVLPLIAWIAVLFFRPNQSRAMQYILVVIGLGLAITLGTEFITLRYDNGRQNTIFKFYIQVWLLFSVAGGVAFAWVTRNAYQWRLRLATPWYTVFGFMFLISVLYPITATQGKAIFRFTSDVPLTLDGMEYMQYTRHWEGGFNDYIELQNDYNIIRWLQENVQGTPVIMEALSTRVTYEWGARIAINTGLPTIIGWDYHQRQQRSLEQLPALVANRRANVNAFYTTPSIDTAVELLRHYNVTYIILSDYERMRYGTTTEEASLGIINGLDKFDVMVQMGVIQVVYQEGQATIYQVIPEALDRVFLASILDDDPTFGGAE